MGEKGGAWWGEENVRPYDEEYRGNMYLHGFSGYRNDNSHEVTGGKKGPIVGRRTYVLTIDRTTRDNYFNGLVDRRVME